jgi:hypothetical protein
MARKSPPTFTSLIAHTIELGEICEAQRVEVADRIIKELRYLKRGRFGGMDLEESIVDECIEIVKEVKRGLT